MSDAPPSFLNLSQRRRASRRRASSRRHTGPCPRPGQPDSAGVRRGVAQSCAGATRDGRMSAAWSRRGRAPPPLRHKRTRGSRRRRALPLLHLGRARGSRRGRAPPPRGPGRARAHGAPGQGHGRAAATAFPDSVEIPERFIRTGDEARAGAVAGEDDDEAYELPVVDMANLLDPELSASETGVSSRSPTMGSTRP
ncbi:hypothetical protein PVAP13_9NG535828 [Panicum virgatum]|uniref:Uncharacterized protein n=1 Tax=Panicum virgatum TaxID=38727 RepID=A0A8T0MSR9_PANVG|nr:hypothetical protein PVAP13_9NG535828 [Panicum virgatum]